MDGSMDDEILNDGLLIQISSEIDEVSPANLSVYLGFNTAQGNNAKVQAHLNYQSAYQTLLHKFVNRHGKDRKSALKLRLTFLEKDMKPCAKIIEKELDKFGITYPSRADTVIGEPFDLPSTPHVKPGSETPVAPTPSEPNRQTRPSHGHGLQPRALPEERQQQQQYIICGTIFAVVVAFIAVIGYFLYVKVL